MDIDTLKQINDNLKRYNGKLLLEIDTLKKEFEALKQGQEPNQSHFYQLSQKMQDLMIRNDALYDENENLKSKLKKIEVNYEYLRKIVRSIERNKLESNKSHNINNFSKENDATVNLTASMNSAVLKEKLKEITGSKFLNPVYERLSLMMNSFFEKGEINSIIFKNGFGISRATFARDAKILKELGYIELMNSKKEGMYILTKSGKKFKKELKKDMKKLPI